MSWNREPLSHGRVTLCGSGGASDCPALRVLDDGRIGMSSSEDPDNKTEVAFEGHELYQLAMGIVGRSAPSDVVAAVDADMDRQAGTDQSRPPTEP